MNILVICAHPDDDVLGCGATLARHAAAGDHVTVCFLTDGEGARASATERHVRKRQQAAEQAASILGVQALEFGQFPDNRLDTIAMLDLARHVEGLASQFPADVIYTHHGGDLNVDHRLVFQAVMTAYRPIASHSQPETILTFEVPSSTEWSSPEVGPVFVPNHFVDVSPTLDQKLRALDAYHDEMRPFPHPRSSEVVKTLAAWRGANSGLKAAEAFTLVRRIVRNR
jgi:LmbE family N-acetylglucosaminyl deacetylase